MNTPIPQNPTIAWLSSLSTAAWIVGVVLSVALLTVTWKGLRAGRRTLRRALTDRPTEDTLTIVAAGIATAVSAQGMWQFFERVLPDTHWTLRVLMFAFIEAAMVTSAYRARRSMRETLRAGVDGLAVWALTGLSAVLSTLLSLIHI